MYYSIRYKSVSWLCFIWKSQKNHVNSNNNQKKIVHLQSHFIDLFIWLRQFQLNDHVINYK